MKQGLSVGGFRARFEEANTAWRGRLTGRLIRRAERRRRASSPDYLEFIPPVRDPGVLADLSARVNWYLGNRGVPIFLSGAEGCSPRPSDAPYLDGSLVKDPGWSVRRPLGRRGLVLHQVTPTTVARALFARDVTLASSSFHLWAEPGWFALHERVARTDETRPHEGVGQLLDVGDGRADAFVLATGPSAKLVDPAAVTQSVRITCNSAVRDHELLAALRPTVIAFADRVFHLGPSRYAASFRKDLKTALDETDAIFVTSRDWVGPLLTHMPEIRERLIVVELRQGADWRWPTEREPFVRATGNVLTNLMLPVAFLLADSIAIAGCDGRAATETYFWRHNAKTQYSDDLMQSAFDAHPAFFRDRDYGDYYDQHCAELEALIRAAEAAGKSVTGSTPSHIPALVRRGAPPL